MTIDFRLVPLLIAFALHAVAPAVRVAEAQTIPASATLSIRTLDDVRAVSAARGQPVRAMVLAPLHDTMGLLVAPRTLLEGTIEDAGAERSTGKRRFVLLHFTAMVIDDSTRVPISARVTSVDNSRDTVDLQGRIIGPPMPGLGRTKSDWAALALGTLNPIAGAVLFAAMRGEALEFQHHVSFPAGTDMTVRVTEDVALPLWPAFRAPEGIASDSALRALLGELPLQAKAATGRVPGDFVNVVFLATGAQIQQAFEAAGWSSPDRLTVKSAFATFVKVAEAAGYAHEPVSKQMLFGRGPDLVFQRVSDTFAKRHHIRLWRTDTSWDGVPVWVAAATHDVGIEFSRQRRGFTHRTDPAIDGERDKTVFDLVAALHAERVSMVRREPSPEAAVRGKVTSDWQVAMVQLVGRPPGTP